MALYVFSYWMTKNIQSYIVRIDNGHFILARHKLLPLASTILWRFLDISKMQTLPIE